MWRAVCFVMHASFDGIVLDLMVFMCGVLVFVEDSGCCLRSYARCHVNIQRKIGLNYGSVGRSMEKSGNVTKFNI